MSPRIPSAASLARLSNRIFKQKEQAQLQESLDYYKKDMDSLLKAMRDTAHQGYSIMEHPVRLPEPVLQLFRQKGYEASSYLRRDTGKYETAISWYKEERQLK